MFRAFLQSYFPLIVKISAPQFKSRRHITKIAVSPRETLIGRLSSHYTALKEWGKTDKLNISIPTTSTKEANSYSLDRKFIE